MINELHNYYVIVIYNSEAKNDLVAFVCSDENKAKEYAKNAVNEFVNDSYTYLLDNVKTRDYFILPHGFQEYVVTENNFECGVVVMKIDDIAYISKNADYLVVCFATNGQSTYAYGTEAICTRYGRRFFRRNHSQNVLYSEYDSEYANGYIETINGETIIIRRFPITVLGDDKYDDEKEYFSTKDLYGD